MSREDKLHAISGKVRKNNYLFLNIPASNLNNNNNNVPLL